MNRLSINRASGCTDMAKRTSDIVCEPHRIREEYAAITDDVGNSCVRHVLGTFGEGNREGLSRTL